MSSSIPATSLWNDLEHPAPSVEVDDGAVRCRGRRRSRASAQLDRKSTPPTRSASGGIADLRACRVGCRETWDRRAGVPDGRIRRSRLRSADDIAPEISAHCAQAPGGMVRTSKVRTPAVSRSRAVLPEPGGPIRSRLAAGRADRASAVERDGGCNVNANRRSAMNRAAGAAGSAVPAQRRSTTSSDCSAAPWQEPSTPRQRDRR